MTNKEKFEILETEKGKGFTVFRGDAAIKKDDIKIPLYEIGKPLHPSIIRSWTTSENLAKRFACEYVKGREITHVPIVLHGVTRRMQKGLFWKPEREVYILKGKSILKDVKIVPLSECEKLKREEKI